MAFIQREPKSELNVTRGQERLKLPPISAMDSLIATRSFAPQTPTETSYIPLPTPPPREQWRFSPPISHETKNYNDYYTAGYSQSLPSRLSSSHLTASPFESFSNNDYKLYQQNPNSYNATATYRAEQDIEEVVLHCNTLSEDMIQKKKTLLESQSMTLLFNNTNSPEPWLEDMIGKANQVLNALLRLRKHQLATQRLKEENSIADSNRWLNGSSSNETRQRRRGKKSNFQGRCHTCNISETPEWRRGPDGARTLCNACGLHYAKLVRKKGQKGIESMEIESYTSRKSTPPADDGLTG